MGITAQLNMTKNYNELTMLPWDARHDFKNIL
jgi:hypothetical protein